LLIDRFFKEEDFVYNRGFCVSIAAILLVATWGIIRIIYNAETKIKSKFLHGFLGAGAICFLASGLVMLLLAGVDKAIIPFGNLNLCCLNAYDFMLGGFLFVAISLLWWLLNKIREILIFFNVEIKNRWDKAEGVKALLSTIAQIIKDIFSMFLFGVKKFCSWVKRKIIHYKDIYFNKKDNMHKK